MQLLDSLSVQHANSTRYIELYHGDLTAMPEPVDLLIVSALPNYYGTEYSTTLIAALHKRGLSVAELAAHKAADLRQDFGCWLSQPINIVQMTAQYRYDLFISYASANRADVQPVVDYLQRQRPSLRIFFDRRELTLGDAWQQQIFEALDDCNKVVAFYSPAYLASKVCKEEFNIALFRHRETENTLLPIYLYTANLPTYMKLIQFTDCREADPIKLRATADAILQVLSQG
ncbi:MAG: hypothetical protein CUN51_05090 [Candidatus Thermofonsia Clade 1 bacterium]|uniref:TIR domain-containing protein n=1 Tax=Candidatus Thermofonsia Clade 1 bacterium TaxID=2364210 RepID=A0A2M8P125_9CHLR|nr:MAG: hypothetical protein CUN51_05090 [Candidatus Thermofonsia Clade 1 bacterium]